MALANDAESTVIYKIDESDRIVYTNSFWDEFACDNDTPDLTAKKVLKRSLWDFIDDAETRHLHQAIINRVRTNQAARSFPFRCDGPTVRRYMTMEIHPAEDNAIIYHCKIDRIEQRAPILFDEQKEWRSKKQLRMCSWCKKVDVGEDDWQEIEDAIKTLQLFERKLLPEISHTMCDTCIKTYGD